MKAWVAKVEINAPIQVVWDCITNLVEVTLWNTYVNKAHILSLLPITKGATFAHERGFRQVIFQIQEFVMDDYIKLSLKVNRITGIAEYQLKPMITDLGLTTALFYTLNLQLQGTDKFAALFIGKIMRKELFLLKNWIEAKRKTTP